MERQRWTRKQGQGQVPTGLGTNETSGYVLGIEVTEISFLVKDALSSSVQAELPGTRAESGESCEVAVPGPRPRDSRTRNRFENH